MIYTSRLQRTEAVRWRGSPGRAIRADLRSRVLAAIDGGHPAKVVAELFQVSVSYIYKALGRRDGDRRDRGAAAAQPADAQARGPSRRDRGRGGARGRTSPWRSCAPGCWRPTGRGEPRA